MKPLILPVEYNYIGVFLTLRCNLGCPYCINRYDKCDYSIPEMTLEDWITGLSRIQTRVDLPISLQGGEPTLYPHFYPLVNALFYDKHQHMDLLTNGTFNQREFIMNVRPEMFQRQAKYASIRVSYHHLMAKEALAIKVFDLVTRGYEIGIWGLGNGKDNQAMKKLCDGLGIDFRTKEFLSERSGTYKYPDAITKQNRKVVLCRGSELLINPSGHIFRCHADLYANRNWIGHILDESFIFPEATLCENYGFCNPCDIKLKTNRFQEQGHCSVEIDDYICPFGTCEVSNELREPGKCSFFFRDEKGNPNCGYG